VDLDFVVGIGFIMGIDFPFGLDWSDSIGLAFGIVSALTVEMDLGKKNLLIPTTFCFCWIAEVFLNAGASLAVGVDLIEVDLG